MADDLSKKDGAAQAAISSVKDPVTNPPKAGTAGTPDLAAPAEESELVRYLKAQQRTGPAVGPTPGLSETIPGGKYRVGDAWQNADGEEIDEDGNLKYPERARKDQFGRITTR